MLGGFCSLVATMLIETFGGILGGVLATSPTIVVA